MCTHFPSSLYRTHFEGSTFVPDATLLDLQQLRCVVFDIDVRQN